MPEPAEPAERFRRFSATFAVRVAQVPQDAWDNPSPCEGWVARDVVRHLVEWLPAFFFDRWGLEHPERPSVDDDPAGAWAAVGATVQAALDNPAVAERVAGDTPMGPISFAAAMEMIGTSDVFLHTWDLARATGLDERLDPDEVHRLYVGMEPQDQLLRQSGHFGPRVAVPDGASEQDRLMAFIGRRP
ncbi:MAG: TIGR03086 family metal-binding protein [Acidimicrobiales bacterium]